MSTIDNTTQRTGFFSGKNGDVKSRKPMGPNNIARNSEERRSEISMATKDDVKVDIPDSIKDFARVKNAVDSAPPIDKSAKIAELRGKINSGTYSVDYDALADKILSNEF